ncbi:MAG: response regulator [Bacteroidota bacterium]|nr:response regulator [Bacteroidota bacterium]
MSKLLIVDDSEDLLEVLKYFLEEKGYEVETVTNKASLLSAIETFSPDLILLDIFLKGEDGREICSELRNHRKTKYLCILMFSASARALENYKEFGADGYVTKPFGLNEIMEKVESVLEKCKDYYPQ